MTDTGKESATFRLSEPITVDGEETSELKFRPARLVNLKGVHLIMGHTGEAKCDLGDAPRLIAALARIPPSAAGAISTRDLLLLVPVILDFLAPAPATGSGPSKTSPGSSAGRPPN